MKENVSCLWFWGWDLDPFLNGCVQGQSDIGESAAQQQTEPFNRF